MFRFVMYVHINAQELPRQVKTNEKKHDLLRLFSARRYFCHYQARSQGSYWGLIPQYLF